jgi:hypothetical protein
MSVPVGIGALAEHLQVLFIAEIRPEKPVGGVKVFATGDVDHKVRVWG